MTEQELIDAIVNVANNINELTYSQLALRIPQRDLRDALLRIGENAFARGVEQGKHTEHEKLRSERRKMEEEMDDLKADIEAKKKQAVERIREAASDVYSLLDDSFF